jgi:UPF0755 protein
VLFLRDAAATLGLSHDRLMHELQIRSEYGDAGLFAETYHVPYGMREKQLIDFLINQSSARYEALSKKIFDTYNRTEWQRILIIASIIQKEAASNDEMPLVASVIYNRLRRNMRLQMDGTLNYGIHSHEKITPERIDTDDSRFNTYKHKGLPPQPICAVSLQAIKAAIKPAKTEYLYFMKNSNGTHDFSRTYKSHQSHIQKRKRSLKIDK